MAQAVFSIGYGKASFDDTSFSLAAFVMDAPWVQEFPAKVMNVRGPTQEFPASLHPNINGRLRMATLEAMDGKIVRLQINYFRNGVHVRNAGVFLKLRETGPMLVVLAKLPPHRQSRLGDNFVQFQGRADILSLEELEENGLKPPRSWVDGYLNADEIELSYEIRETDREVSARPKVERVTSLSGRQVTIRAAQSTRRVKVRR